MDSDKGAVEQEPDEPDGEQEGLHSLLPLPSLFVVLYYWLCTKNRSDAVVAVVISDMMLMLFVWHACLLSPSN